MINIYDSAIAKLKEGFKIILFILLGLASINGLLAIIYFAVKGFSALSILAEVLETFISIGIILYVIFAFLAHDGKRLALAITIDASYIFLLSLKSLAVTVFNWYGDAVTVFYLIFNLIMVISYITVGVLVCRNYISGNREFDGVIKVFSVIALIAMLFEFVFTVIESARGNLAWYSFVSPLVSMAEILILTVYYFGIMGGEEE